MSGALKFAIDALAGVEPAYRQCARELLEFLAERIPGVFADCCDRLFELAAEARSDVDQARYFEGMRELERRRNRLCRAFVERVDDGLTQFFRERRAVPRASEQSGRRELRILDDRDLAVTLAVDSIVDSAEIRLTRELYALGVRLGQLTGRGALSNDLNPAAPRALCAAFRDTLVTVESEIEVHQALYKSFDQGLVRALEGLYQRLNQGLAEAGVVPELKYSIEREPTTQPASADSDAAQAALEREAALERDAEAAEYELERQLIDRVRTMLARRRQSLMPPATAPAAPTRALREVLSSLQTELASSDGNGLTADAIKTELLKTGRGGEPCSLSPADEDTLDLLGMMFDFVSADRHLPDPFHGALRRLQVPYLRAALGDPARVMAPESPARRLLEELSLTAVGWSPGSDRGGEVLAKAHETVDLVVREFWDDERVLERLLGDLRAFRLARERIAERRARRAAQSMRGSEQLAFARHNVAKLLSRRLQNRPLPGLVRNLLERAWAHVMVLTVLRHGLNSEQWKRALATADELIWSVSFKRSEKAIKRLRTRMPVLARALSKGLKAVGYQDAEIDKILKHLARIHQALLRESGSDAVLVEVDPGGITISGESLLDQVDLDATEVVDEPDGLSEMLDQVRAWPTGKWVIFHQDQGHDIRAKLSWISPITGQYLFVDQRGLRAAEKSLSELAQDLASDRVEPLDQASIVTRALGGIAERLGGAQATSS